MLKMDDGLNPARRRLSRRSLKFLAVVFLCWFSANTVVYFLLLWIDLYTSANRILMRILMELEFLTLSMGTMAVLFLCFLRLAREAAVAELSKSDRSSH